MARVIRGTGPEAGRDSQLRLGRAARLFRLGLVSAEPILHQGMFADAAGVAGETLRPVGKVEPLLRQAEQAALVARRRGPVGEFHAFGGVAAVVVFITHWAP
jgi:hypothetical protein